VLFSYFNGRRRWVLTGRVGQPLLSYLRNDDYSGGDEGSQQGYGPNKEESFFLLERFVSPSSTSLYRFELAVFEGDPALLLRVRDEANDESTRVCARMRYWIGKNLRVDLLTEDLFVAADSGRRALTLPPRAKRRVYCAQFT